jgi:hypothetical protein
VDAWIEAARQQLTTTPLSVRAAALRHALAEPGGESPKRAAATRTRPVALLAGDTEALEAPLRRAGFDVRRIPFTVFDEAAAGKVQHFETYNRTAAGQRVADIARALRDAPGAVLIAAGETALAGALAAAVERPRLAVLDVRGFDTSRDDDFLRQLYIPGLRRAGDLQTAGELAGDRLVIHGAGSHFEAKGARIERTTLSPERIVALARGAAR